MSSLTQNKEGLYITRIECNGVLLKLFLVNVVDTILWYNRSYVRGWLVHDKLMVEYIEEV